MSQPLTLCLQRSWSPSPLNTPVPRHTTSTSVRPVSQVSVPTLNWVEQGSGKERGRISVCSRRAVPRNHRLLLRTPPGRHRTCLRSGWCADRQSLFTTLTWKGLWQRGLQVSMGIREQPMQLIIPRPPRAGGMGQVSGSRGPVRGGDGAGTSRLCRAGFCSHLATRFGPDYPGTLVRGLHPDSRITGLSDRVPSQLQKPAALALGIPCTIHMRSSAVDQHQVGNRESKQHWRLTGRLCAAAAKRG